MVPRFLRWLGLLSLLALVGGAIAALWVVRQRLDVTVAPAIDRAPATPPPWAGVSDEIASLRADLKALAAALGPALESQLAAIDAAADDRSAAQRATADAIASELAALRQEQQREWSTLRAEVAALTARVADRPVASGDPGPPSATASAELVPEPVAAPATAPEVAAAAAGAVAPLARKRGFLRFELPSESFVFDRRQRLVLLPALSRVGFDAKSTLHDFTGVTSALEGELVVNLAAPGDRPSGRIVVDAASLSTDLAARDEKMREHLGAARHPQLEFRFTGFDDPAVDVVAQSVRGTARGELTLHGVTRPVAFPVAVSVDPVRRVVIEGGMPLRMSEWGVEVPSQLGVIGVEDEVRLWVALRARSFALPAEGG